MMLPAPVPDGYQQDYVDAELAEYFLLPENTSDALVNAAQGSLNGQLYGCGEDSAAKNCLGTGMSEFLNAPPRVAGHAGQGFYSKADARSLSSMSQQFTNVMSPDVCRMINGTGPRPHTWAKPQQSSSDKLGWAAQRGQQWQLQQQQAQQRQIQLQQQVQQCQQLQLQEDQLQLQQLQQQAADWGSLGFGTGMQHKPDALCTATDFQMFMAPEPNFQLKTNLDFENDLGFLSSLTDAATANITPAMLAMALPAVPPAFNPLDWTWGFPDCSELEASLEICSRQQQQQFQTLPPQPPQNPPLPPLMTSLPPGSTRLGSSCSPRSPVKSDPVHATFEPHTFACRLPDCSDLEGSFDNCRRLPLQQPQQQQQHPHSGYQPPCQQPIQASTLPIVASLPSNNAGHGSCSPPPAESVYTIPAVLPEGNDMTAKSIQDQSCHPKRNDSIPGASSSISRVFGQKGSGSKKSTSMYSRTLAHFLSTSAPVVAKRNDAMEAADKQGYQRTGSGVSRSKSGSPEGSNEESDGLESPSDDENGKDINVPQPPANLEQLHKQLKTVYHLPIKQAASLLNSSVSCLKKICRKLHIRRWPYRKLVSLDNLARAIKADKNITQVERQAALQHIMLSRSRIMEDPNSEVDPHVHDMRQANYKMKYEASHGPKAIKAQAKPNRKPPE